MNKSDYALFNTAFEKRGSFRAKNNMLAEIEKLSMLLY